MEKDKFVDKLCEIGKEMKSQKSKAQKGHSGKMQDADRKVNDNKKFILYCLSLIGKYALLSDDDVRKMLTTKLEKGKDDSLIKELGFTPAVSIISEKREKGNDGIIRHMVESWEYEGKEYHASTEWGDDNKQKFASWLFEKLNQKVDDNEWEQINHDIDDELARQDQIKNQQTEYAKSSGINVTS